MTEVRYKNLYDALTSHIDYCNFIESHGQDDISFKNTNFDLLQTIYGAFSLTQIIEDVFKKNGENYQCTMMKEALKQIVSKVAVYNGKGYTVGDLMYHDEFTVLEKLRNKLAHGDFIIRNGEIIFEENQTEGRVKVDDFLSLITGLESSFEYYSLNKPYIKIYNMYTTNPSVHTIETEKDMDKVCENQYIVEIVDFPISPRNRNGYSIKLREFLYEKIEPVIAKGSINELEKELKKCKETLMMFGIQIEFSIRNIKTLDYYPEVKEKFMSEKDIYKYSSFSKQINRINNISYILGFGRYQKMDIRKSLLLNRVFMKLLKEHPEQSLEEILKNNDYLVNMVLYHYDTTIISSYLVGFNSIYEYGLEKGLTKLGDYNLVLIYEGKSMDFSNLELEELDDPNMLIEHKFEKYKNDVTIYENKKIADIDKTIESKRKKVKQYENYANKDPLKEVLFAKELKDAEELKIKFQDSVKDIKVFASQFDLNKYVKNYNIIFHIRNAIAHGNVYVDSYATDISETDIIFKDYLGDKVVYEKKIKVKDFVKLFRADNISAIYTFITNNISDKSTIDENYIEEITQRSILRDVRNNGVQLTKRT